MAPTLVLLHGFTHTGASWDPVVATVGERYRCLAPDIRGHGVAGHMRPIDFDSCVADVAELAPANFSLAGYSMGGRIGLAFALAHPERVASLTLIGASPGIEETAQRSERLAADRALAAELEELSIEALAERWGRTRVLADQPAEVALAAREDRLRNTPQGLAAALRGIGTGSMVALWDRLGELTMPVVLVTGDRDLKFRRKAEFMQTLIAGSTHVVVEDAGHAVHLERPVAAAAAIA